jgi:hypothetical protein
MPILKELSRRPCVGDGLIAEQSANLGRPFRFAVARAAEHRLAGVCTSNDCIHRSRATPIESFLCSKFARVREARGNLRSGVNGAVFRYGSMVLKKGSR